MELELVNQLCESKIIRSTGSLKKYTIQDLADLTFLSILALEILINEFDHVSYAKKYATKTLQYGDFGHLRFSATDLYALLNIMLSADQHLAKMKGSFENNELFSKRIRINQAIIIRYLAVLKQGTVPKNTSYLFLQLQNDCNIQNGSYKDLRVLISNWKNQDHHSKSLVLTRLIQAFRFKAPQSELLSELTIMAKKQNLLIKDAKNAEKPEEEKIVPGWMKPAMMAAAAYGGYKLMRGSKNDKNA